MESKPSLAIFLKAPRAGRVKTRLVPLLGEKGAADLYTAFVGDTVTLACAASARHLLLFTDGDDALANLSPDSHRHLEGLGPDHLHLFPQVGTDLGARLRAAIEEADERRLMPLLVLGSDSPDLPPGHLEEALGALRSADVVLGPASDGGVWCIGLARHYHGFFDDLPWSTSETGAALRNRAIELGLKAVLVSPWHDVDEPEDLHALWRRLSGGQNEAAETGEWLSQHPPPSTPRPESHR